MQTKTDFRPSISEIYALLQRHNMLIVHFSGAPKGSGTTRPNHLYPNDLNYVLNGHANSGLSCSTVSPGDTFSGFERNATGCIGTILGLKSPQSLIDAIKFDCGSMQDSNGFRVTQNPKDLSIIDLEETITGRGQGSYNEWVISNFEVLGIFAAMPLEVSYMADETTRPELSEFFKISGPVADIKNISFQQVLDDFPSYPIFTFNGSKIYRVTNEGRINVNHREIYTFK